MACQKKQATATSYYEKVLDMMKKKFGGGSEELIPIYQALGRVRYCKDWRYYIVTLAIVYDVFSNFIFDVISNSYMVLL